MNFGSSTLAAAVTVTRLIVVGALLEVGKTVIAYRQHDCGPMWFLALGLCLLLVVPPSTRRSASRCSTAGPESVRSGTIYPPSRPSERSCY